MKTIVENKVQKVQRRAITSISNKLHKTDALSLFETMKRGVDYNFFLNAPGNKSFNLREWSGILHVSERTMQRYKKESIPFEPLQSEKILQIALIFQKGESVFGEMDKFNRWLEEENEALGGKKPKEYLNNAFGIALIENELVKIEYGIFA